MNVAIIPARGGSKRISRKNIKEFCGKPMIAWSIEAALKSGCFEQVIVSTDDAEIAEVAVQHGASVPFMRPAELSDDHTGTTPVVRHAIEWLNLQGSNPQYVCCLYATAPLIDSQDILKGLNALDKEGGDYAFSVTSYAFPIQRAIRINEDGRVDMFNPEYFAVRSQDLEHAYHDAGQFYWGTYAAWLENRVIFGKRSLPIILPRHRVQDIDTLEDWEMAEYLFKAVRLRDSSL
ncbi:pseudaminic acid cytidylyltransferase [Pseudomonas protegens]|uniref:pseudaminic acid cytidylyltransferase n=1 Tax=Pseudomonas protegens TaxID=380021 RepID=UPI001F3B4DF7|nr:pseudaminic acid cytidylyltransferase [Pseudomonas protegens]MDS9878803.1 pseudaminic acid cytidylyltransferase [Pseudomonas protegens]